VIEIVTTMRSISTTSAFILLAIVFAEGGEESVVVQRSLGKIWCDRDASA
jgi:hypothetical protein